MENAVQLPRIINESMGAFRDLTGAPEQESHRPRVFLTEIVVGR